MHTAGEQDVEADPGPRLNMEATTAAAACSPTAAAVAHNVIVPLDQIDSPQKSPAAIDETALEVQVTTVRVESSCQ
jgi:hypothetical protein